MAKRAIDWSYLPTELLAFIGKSLDPHVDIPRFRGVCTSWRSSIPTALALPPRFPLEFQSPLAGLFSEREFELRACLYESRLYLVKPLNPFLASTSSCNEGWLIKVQYDSGSGRLHLYDPFTDSLDYHKPMTLSLLNCRIVELGKTYKFRPLGACSDFGSIGTKVVMSASPDESATFLILYSGILAFAREGNEKLIVIDDRKYQHDYIVVYKGQFYSVDIHGRLWWIENSSLKMVQFLSPPSSVLYIAGHKRYYLVESCGSLYLIPTYWDRKKNYRSKWGYPFELVDLDVYKLDEECGQWVLIRSLGDQAFFLGSDYSFSILASELIGCQKNCIYLLERHGTGGIFDMEDHSIQDLSSKGYTTLYYNLSFIFPPCTDEHLRPLWI